MPDEQIGAGSPQTPIGQAILGTRPAAPEATPQTPIGQAILDPVGATIRQHAAEMRPWSDVSASLSALGANPDQLRQHYELAVARQVVSNRDELTDNPLLYFAKRSVAGASTVIDVAEKRKYMAAVKRFNDGRATGQDIGLIANFEKQNQVEADASTGRKLLSAAAGIPAILGETALAGPFLGGASKVAQLRAITAARGAGLGNSVAKLAGGAAKFGVTTGGVAALPATGPYSGAYQRAIDQGGSPTDLKNAAPATAMAFVQAAVLGRLGQSQRSLLARVPIQAGKGVLEQQVGDAALGAADEILPDAYKTRTRYGLIGQLVRGESGEAAQHGTIQALTFAAFAALHGRPATGRKLIEAQKQVMDDAAGKGQPASVPAQAIAQVHQTIAQVQAQNPTATRAEIAKVLPKPSGALGGYVDAVLDTLPEQPTAQQPPPEEPSGGEVAARPIPQPASPLDRLSKDQLEELAKSVGSSPKRLREQQAEPWVAKLAEAAYPPDQLGEIPTGQPAPAPAAGTTFFRTAQGSLYARDADGRTTRVKAPHGHVGHDAGDVGLKETSDKTVYVPAGVASALSSAGVQGVGKARVVLHDGKATLVTWNEKEGRWGATASGRNVPVSDQPQVGLAPLELWKPRSDVPGAPEAYGRMHAGNAIVAEVPHAEGHAALTAAREGAQNAPESSIAPEAVQPAETGDRAAEAKSGASPANLTLETVREGRNIKGGREIRYRVRDESGKAVAEATVFPEGDPSKGETGDLHVEFVGRPGSSPDDPSGGVGAALNNAVLAKIAEQFPNATHVTGYRQSGARSRANIRKNNPQASESDIRRMQWTRQAIPGRTPAEAPRPAEPPAAGDPFAALAAHGILREPAPQVAARPNPAPEVLKRPVVETDTGRNVGAKLAAAKTPEAREALYAEFDDLSKPDMRDALDAIGVPHKGLERPQMKEAVRQWADRQKPKPPPPELKRTKRGDVAPASRASLEHAARSQEPAQRQMAGEVLAGQAKQAGLTAEAFAAREHPQLHADLGDAGIRALAASEAQAVGRRLKEEVFRLVHQYSTSNGESGRVMPEELLKQFDALSPKEKKAALAEYGVTNTKALSGKKLSEAMRKEVEKRYDAQDRIFAGEDQPKKKQPKPGSTLRRAIIRSGGLDPNGVNFLAHFSGMQEAREFGMTDPGLFAGVKKGGRDLSELAQELYNEGHLRTPDPDELVDALKSGKESQHYYQSEEYQRHLQEEHDARREAEAAGHSAESIAEATRRGESAEEDRVEADAEVPPTAGDAAAGSAGRTAQGVSRPTDLFGEPIRATPKPAKKGTQLTLEDQLREGWVDAGKAWAEEHGIEVGQWRAGGEFVDTEGRVYRVTNTEKGYEVQEVAEEPAGPQTFDPAEFGHSDAALRVGTGDTEGQTLKGGAPFGSGTPLPRPVPPAEQRTASPGGPASPPPASPELAGKPNPGPGETALANATVAAQNRVRAARLAFGRLWEQAQERIAAEPTALEDLMDRLESGERQTVNDLEGAMLLHRKVELLNQRDAAYQELRRVSDPANFRSVTAEERSAASRQAQWLESLSYRLDRITQKVGTQLGRALAFRRQLAKEDYSLSNLIGRAIQAKGGKPLTPEERSELEALAAKLQAAEAKLAALERKEQAGEKSDTAGGRVGRKRARAEADEFIAKLGEQQLSLAQKVFRRTGDALNAARSLLTAFDLSAVFRQGGMFTFGHPLKAARAFPEMIRSFGSQEGFDRARDALDQRENAAAYKSAGLHIADVGGPLSKQEEAFVGRWTKKIPGLAGSERAYTAFLNRVRADWYDALTASLPAGGKPTAAEARAIAKFVNIATGRGDAKALDRTASTLAHVFFSPRYVASRFQLLAGVPFWGGNAATRRVIAQEYGRTAAGLLAFYAVMAAANDDMKLTFDPRSADFGKVVEGKTRIDPLMGLSQTVVFPTRLLTGESTNTKSGDVQPLRGKHAAPTHNAETVIWRYLRSKLAPVPGTVYDVVKGETFDRQPATAVNVAGNYVPIAAADVAKNLEDQGVPRGAVNSVLAILGMGNQVYSK